MKKPPLAKEKDAVFMSFAPDNTVKIQDASWLKPLAQYYKLGGFDNEKLPPRIANALDSLTWYFE